MCLPQVGYVSKYGLKLSACWGVGRLGLLAAPREELGNHCQECRTGYFVTFVWRLSEWLGFGERGNVVSRTRRRASQRLQPEHECQVFKCLRLIGNVSCKP